MAKDKVKPKVENTEVKLPAYEAYLSLADIREVSNYRAENTKKIFVSGVFATHADVSEFDIGVFTLERGLKSINGEKVTKDNFEKLLRSNLDNLEDDVITLSHKIYNEQVKKK